MTEIVDRVARAIYGNLAAYTHPIQDVSPDAFDKESDFRKSQMRDWARAAIGTMRGATGAMLNAGLNAEAGRVMAGSQPFADIGAQWDAMINEALK